MSEVDQSTKSRPIVWNCAECGLPVKDGGGWITVSYAAIGEVERAWSEYERKKKGDLSEDARVFQTINLADLMELPPPARWRVFHRKCDPDQKTTAYWFAIERCRTEAHLLHWTAHLMGKNWLHHTDWDEFIEARGEYA